MSIPENLNLLTGNWEGNNRLHLPWKKENPIRDSKTNASVSFSAQNKFLKIEYDWEFEGKKQDGLILLGKEKDAESVKVIWIDSWHMDDKSLISEGVADATGEISVKGFYSVPNHPDWGWRTTFESADEKSFKITMYNVSPEGEEDIAVEANYQRK